MIHTHAKRNRCHHHAIPNGTSSTIISTCTACTVASTKAVEGVDADAAGPGVGSTVSTSRAAGGRIAGVARGVAAEGTQDCAALSSRTACKAMNVYVPMLLVLCPYVSRQLCPSHDYTACVSPQTCLRPFDNCHHTGASSHDPTNGDYNLHSPDPRLSRESILPRAQHHSTTEMSFYAVTCMHQGIPAWYVAAGTPACRRKSHTSSAWNCRGRRANAQE